MGAVIGYYCGEGSGRGSDGHGVGGSSAATQPRQRQRQPGGVSLEAKAAGPARVGQSAEHTRAGAKRASWQWGLRRRLTDGQQTPATETVT